MSRTSISKTFVKYVSLNVLSMLGLSLYFLADTFFVAQGAGEIGLVALTLALPVFSIVNGTGLLLGIGGSTLFSVAMGENKPDKANRIFTEVMTISFVCSAIYTVVGTLSARPLAGLLGAEGENLESCVTYLRTVLAFSSGFVIENTLLCFVRNDNSPKLAMAAMLTGSFSNILLDYIFVFPCGWGIFGAAFATGISPLLGLVVLFLHFRKGKSRFRMSKTQFYHREILRAVAAGTPSLLTELSSGVLILVFNTVTLKLGGQSMVAAYSVVANLALVGVAVFNGVGQGIQPIISYQYGAQQPKLIRSCYFYGILTVLGFGALFVLTGFTLHEPIVALFNGENNAELAAIANRALPIYFLAFLPMGVNIVSTSLFACTARSKQSFAVSLLRGFLLSVPLVITIPMLFGVNAIWFAIPVAETLTLLTLAVLVWRSKLFSKPRADSL